ncbi:hypothetical protein CGZ80_17490 [Rhodopirellula sp. MGV]|nr:hypothetical protein CGZ80_17490 [Rhodopirellula sp. MGV]
MPTIRHLNVDTNSAQVLDGGARSGQLTCLANCAGASKPRSELQRYEPQNHIAGRHHQLPKITHS